MLRIFLPVLIAGLLLGHTPLATAEGGVVYRWRDAAGEMHFDQIPPRGVPYDIISPSGAKATELTPSGNKINKSGLSGDTEAFLERAQAEREAKEKAKAAEKQANRPASATSFSKNAPLAGWLSRQTMAITHASRKTNFSNA